MDDAEDVVQSMFLKIWEKRQALNINHTFKSYLYKAVYHQCVNQFRPSCGTRKISRAGHR
jgi:RNA polymerase sigma-70 factor (ECF subfamily)